MSGRRRRTIAVGGVDSLVADDRGVSDVVGYILVFSLITITIGTVFAVGITGVEDRREAERVANVERAFDVLDDNLRDIQRYGDPNRATEVRLAGGTLSIDEETRIVLANTTDPADLPNGTLADWTSRRIAYQEDETTIAYDAGALVRGDGDGSVMLSEPRFVGDDGRTTLPVVALVRGDTDERVAGDGTVQITAVEGVNADSETTQYAAASGETLYLWIETDQPEAWGRYFDRADGFDDATPASVDDAAVAEIEHDDEVYVREIVRLVGLQR